MSATTGVLLMTFGTASSVADVSRYLSSVRGGREVPPDLVSEFRRRFELVGGSPLIEITARQAEALESRLNRSRYVVRAGMRHSEPTIRAAIQELVEAGAARIIGIVLSPQFSPRLMTGYLTALEQAAAEIDPPIAATVIGSWHLEPPFIEALADRVRSVVAESHEDTIVIFTAHSLPRSVADGEPAYIAALEATANAVAAAARLPAASWRFSYQSAGHTREEWLKPDLADLFPELREAGASRVVIAPIQFLSDHLEVLYDLDVAAREQAESVGLQFSRIPSLNADPGLIEALAGVVQREAKSG